MSAKVHGEKDSRFFPHSQLTSFAGSGNLEIPF